MKTKPPQPPGGVVMGSRSDRTPRKEAALVAAEIFACNHPAARKASLSAFHRLQTADTGELA
ncbi:MAG: hypothetical protein WC076_09545 [Terrimicrobiaceae bacterium]|nr:hypothetical protein [Terrimicrobiaceae bacterium]